MDESLAAVLADGLRRERASQRRTQDELAACLGVSQATWSAIEAGKRRLSLEDLELLCGALGVNLDALLGTTPRGRKAAVALGICAAVGGP